VGGAGSELRVDSRPLLTKPSIASKLKRFYARVRPAGPFWGPIAREVKEELGRSTPATESRAASSPGSRYRNGPVRMPVSSCANCTPRATSLECNRSGRFRAPQDTAMAITASAWPPSANFFAPAEFKGARGHFAPPQCSLPERPRLRAHRARMTAIAP